MEAVDGRLAGFLAVSAVLILTPGPDTALVIRNSLRSGQRAGSLTAAGVAVGTLWWAAASVLGIAVLLETSAVAFTVLKLAGAVYLTYLGVRGLLSSFGTSRREDSASDLRRERLDDRAAFRQGVLSNLFNAKTGAFFVTVIPQFVAPGDSPTRMALMLLVYEAVLLAWLNLYAYGVDRAGRSGVGRRVRVTLGRVTGLVLVGLGVRLALEKR
jgi:threonine/homoserine/homoserine lactone efflux protein